MDCKYISYPQTDLPSAIPIEFSTTLFVKIYILVSKFIWKHKGPRIAKTILNKTVRKLFFLRKKSI